MSKTEVHNMWRLKDTFYSNQYALEETKEHITKFLESKENENIAYQNLCVQLRQLQEESS